MRKQKQNKNTKIEDRKDLIKFKRLFYPKTVRVPGVMEVNGSMLITEKLPSDWHVSVKFQVKTAFGYFTMPCIKKWCA